MKTEFRKVRLLKPHRHQGVLYNEGDEIELTKEQADWLKEVYVAERVQARKQYSEFLGLGSTDSKEEDIND